MALISLLKRSTANGGFGKLGHQMVQVRQATQIKLNISNSFLYRAFCVLGIHSETSVKFVSPFHTCSNINKFNYVNEKNKNLFSCESYLSFFFNYLQ